MNKKTMNRLHMIKNVQAFFEAHGGVFKDDAHYQNLEAELNGRVDQLLTLEQDLLVRGLPLGERKKALQDHFAKAVERLGLLLREVAMAQQLKEILDFTSAMSTPLRRGKVVNCLAYGREIIEFSETHRSAIEAQSRGNIIFDEAEDALKAFENIATLPHRNQKEYFVLVRKINRLVKENTAFINTSVTTFIKSWETVYPDIAALYFENADEPLFGKRYAKKPEEAASEGGTPPPTEETAPAAEADDSSESNNTEADSAEGETTEIAS